MKRKNIIKYISINGIIAALYVILSVVLGEISFGTNGFIDFRLSEILMMFCFISPYYFPGLIIGCFLSNVLMSAMAIDFVVGTAQTVIACFLMYFLRKHKQLGIIVAALTCGIMIGLEIYCLGFSVIGLWILVSVFLSELLVLEIGYVIFIPLMKNKYFAKLVSDFSSEQVKEEVKEQEQE